MNPNQSEFLTLEVVLDTDVDDVLLVPLEVLLGVEPVVLDTLGVEPVDVDTGVDDVLLVLLGVEPVEVETGVD